MPRTIFTAAQMLLTSSKSQEPNPKEKDQIPRSKMEDGAKPRDLEDRTFEFAQSVRAFVKQLPRTVNNTEDVGTSGVIHKLNIEKLIAANPLSPRLRRGFRKRRHFTALQKES